MYLAMGLLRVDIHWRFDRCLTDRAGDMSGYGMRLSQWHLAMNKLLQATVRAGPDG